MKQLEIILTDLDNKQYRTSRPLYFSCVKSDDTPADSLEVKFFDSVFPGKLPEIKSAEVWSEGERLFQGICDGQEWEAGSGGGIVSVQARGMGALLLDNEALPQTYSVATIWELFQRHIQPYGFSCGISFSGQTASYTVSKGQSEWEAFSGLCRKLLGRSPFLQGGRVLILSEGGAVHSLEREESRVLRAAHRIDRTNGISQVFIRDPDGRYSTVVNNQEAFRLGLRRKRYWIPPAQWAAPDRDAKLQLQRSMERRVCWEVELAGLINWKLGDAVQLGRLGDGSWTIAELRHRFHQKGATTVIVLLGG